MRRKVQSGFLCLVLLLACALAGCGGKGGGKVVIVVPEGADVRAAELVQQAFLEQWGKEFAIITDAAAPKRGTEVLVGHTSRPESAEAAEGLREEDFAITFGPQHVAVVGGSDEKTLEAARYFAQHYLDYYVEAHTLPNDSSVNYRGNGPYPVQTMELERTGIGSYAIVTEDGTAKSGAAAYLQRMLEDATGYRFNVLAPGEVAPGQRVIALGSSGYGEAAAIAGALSAGEFHVKSANGDLYLCAGPGEDETAAAKMLVLRLMEYDPFSKNAAQREVYLNDVDLKFTTRITKTEGYEVLLEQVFRLPAEGVFTVFQGGCTDGTYAYYIMNNQTHHPYTNYIYKVDTRTWTVVARSEELALDHANSLAYNGVTHQLVVSNYEPNYSTLTLLNPDTLEIIERVTVGFNALNITHNASRNEYAIGLSGTYNFVVTDGAFNVLSYNEGPNYGHIKQEADCDDEFIYFTQSNENHIIVHDWQGAYVTDVRLGLYIEVENMIHVGGKVYTGFFTNGGSVYGTIIFREITG